MIKAFQLRAARSVTGLGVREIGSYLKVSRTIISKWEQQDIHFIIQSNVTNPDALIFFFKQYNVDISNPFCITYITNVETDTKLINSLSRFQLRASRTALGFTQETLGQRLNVQRNIIHYLENNNNTQLLSNLKRNIDHSAIKEFFIDQGITYPDQFTIKVSE